MAEEIRDRRNASQYRRSSDPWRPVLAVVGIAILAALLLDNASFVRAQDLMSPESSFNDVAFLGGIKRTNDTDRFRRGEAKAVMGAVKLDLRDASMEGSEAVLDVSSIMGGVEVRVPDTWTVVSRVNTVLGGFEDRTRHPKDDRYRVILEGTVLMGGLKVEN